MDEQLLPDDGKSSHQQATESLQRSSSLLERIRAQREREAAAERESTSNYNNGADVESNTSTSTGPVNIPNYDPIVNDAVGGGGGDPGTSSSFGFSGFSMDFGGFGNDQRGESSQSLLAEHEQENAGISSDGSYSMSGYFRMFVMDVYLFFRSLPIPVQAFLIVFLLWVVWKLI